MNRGTLQARLKALSDELKRSGVRIASLSFEDVNANPPQIRLPQNLSDDQTTVARRVIDTFDWSLAAHQAEKDVREPILLQAIERAAQARKDIDEYLAKTDATVDEIRAEIKAIDQRQKQILAALARLARKVLDSSA